MIRTLLAVLSLAHAAYAFQMPTLVARTAIRSHRANSVSMIVWDDVHADTAWTQSAWEAMGLTPDNLHGCVLIPDKFVPDQGFKRSRSWYFCTYNGAEKAGANCIQLPTYDDHGGLYLCSMGHGQLPSYADD